MNECKHLNRQGDNYGVSCMDCGVQIAGYGYWGDFPFCMHRWIPTLDNKYLQCYYCEREMDNWGLSDEREDLYA